MGKIITQDRSIIPACDVSMDEFEDIVKQTADIDGVGAYKVGFMLALPYGLPRVVETARKHTSKPIIYDHQKAGTDIPDVGQEYAKVVKGAGIDAVIFFPMSGPATEETWIKAAQDRGLGVIVGGLMTHPQYLKSEGGYIDDEAILEMYLKAARLCVTDFVVPGNKPDDITRIRGALEAERVEPVFYAPGFVAQGGKISEGAEAAGNRFHAIVGRGITKAVDKRNAAMELTSQLY